MDEISPELEQIIEKVFERCFEDKEYKQVNFTFKFQYFK